MWSVVCSCSDLLGVDDDDHDNVLPLSGGVVSGGESQRSLVNS